MRHFAACWCPRATARCAGNSAARMPADSHRKQERTFTLRKRRAASGRCLTHYSDKSTSKFMTWAPSQPMRGEDEGDDQDLREDPQRLVVDALEVLARHQSRRSHAWLHRTSRQAPEIGCCSSVHGAPTDRDSPAGRRRTGYRESAESCTAAGPEPCPRSSRVDCPHLRADPRRPAAPTTPARPVEGVTYDGVTDYLRPRRERLLIHLFRASSEKRMRPLGSRTKGMSLPLIQR